jgi:NADH/NAD ratio-sensing transcriptional regulator Rex
MGAGIRPRAADYPGFRQGVRDPALFDNLREKVGQQSRGGVPIYDIHDLKKVSRREGIRIAVIAVPQCRRSRSSTGRVGHQGGSFARRAGARRRHCG